MWIVEIWKDDTPLLFTLLLVTTECLWWNTCCTTGLMCMPKTKGVLFILCLHLGQKKFEIILQNVTENNYRHISSYFVLHHRLEIHSLVIKGNNRYENKFCVWMCDSCFSFAVVWFPSIMPVRTVTTRWLSCWSDMEPQSMWPTYGSSHRSMKLLLRANTRSANCCSRLDVHGPFLKVTNHDCTHGWKNTLPDNGNNC